MLVMRKVQMEAFGKYMAEEFENNMAEHLRAAFPAQIAVLSEPELRSLVHNGAARAQSYGVRMRPDIRRYLECMVVYGADFDTSSRTGWAGRILRAKSLSGAEKMDMIALEGRLQSEAGR